MDKRIVRLTAMAGAVAALPMMAQGGADEAEQLRARLAVMESENAALREAVGDRNLNNRQHEELQRLTAQAAGDPAINSASFFQGGNAGYRNGFFIESADGAFKLNHTAQLQVRYVLSFQDDSPEDDFRSGFENRRTKLHLRGSMYDDWKFGVTGAFSFDGGAFTLEDAYVGRSLGDGWSLKFGQFKGPFLREELVDSANQLLVERSLVNSQFTTKWTQGIQLGYQDDQFRFHVMYNDGAHEANRPALAEATDFAFTARGEMLLNGDGDWGRFNDLTSPMDDDGFAALFGVGMHYQHDERGTGDGTGGPGDFEIDWFGLTLDASLEFGGANLFGAFIYRYIDQNLVGHFNQYGLVVQGGFYLNEEWELFGRYEYGDLDFDDVKDLHIITAGFNYYINSHNAKWTTDIGVGLEEVSWWWADGGAGWRGDADGKDAQVVVRTQFQFLY